jgi:hypothetical protein
MVISLMVLFIISCSKTTYEEYISCESPNWTSDGKVVFVREKEVWKTVEDIGVRSDIVSDSTWLYEVNADGSGRENKGLLFDDAAFGGGGLSSAGGWVVFGDADNNIWVVRRDGTSLQEVGEGRKPDFSPDVSQIVYEKRNEGIWIIDRNGDNDYQIISDTDARYPAWSPDDTLIGYVLMSSPYVTCISNLDGDSVKFYSRKYFLDWDEAGSNSIFIQLWSGLYAELNILTDEVDSVDITQEGISKCSPNGEYFIGRDSDWFIINRAGNNKWYLQP